MEQLLKQLRKFYLLISLPALAVFLLSFVTADAPLFSPRVCYYMLIFLYLIALVAIPVTSFRLKRVVSKCEDSPKDEQARLYAKAYKERIVALNVISYLTGPFYIITAEVGCSYLFGIVTIVILLSYPSERFVFRQND